MIKRTKSIKGINIPGIIKNQQYYFTNMSVYEDGMVNCWGLEDIETIKGKIAEGWAVTSIPDGDKISVHGLAVYAIDNGEWYNDKKEYYKLIKSKLLELNPNLDNLFRYPNSKINAVRKLPREYVEYEEQGKHLINEIPGTGFHILVSKERYYKLMNLVVYKSGNIKCYDLEEELNYDFDSIDKLFRDGTFMTKVEPGEKIIVSGLGEFVVKEVMMEVDVLDKLGELKENFLKLKGDKTAFEKCRAMYHEYLEYPTEHKRKLLKEYYELIPKHQRMYLGDMDNRDTDYYRIIYKPDEKREV